MPGNLRTTPLNDEHVGLGARMVDYAGWSMPVMYKGILDESRQVRSSQGLFDISHMGRIVLDGSGATRLLQSITTNDVSKLAAGKAQYSLLPNSNGGIVDDIIVYRESDERYLVVINASNTAKDISWIQERLPSGVTLTDHTAGTAMIAVQGPNAVAAVAMNANETSLESLGRFEFRSATIGGNHATFCRTGYTGEDGFEIIVPAAGAAAVWKLFIESGAEPCGLGARDTLRIEAGYPLYGHEIDDDTNPLEAGLGWVVSFDKGPFVGRDQILSVREKGPTRRLVGLVSSDRMQPRQGYTVLSNGTPVGVVTSGAFSPTRNCSIAMAFVSSAHAKTGVELEIAIRDKRIKAAVVPKKNLLHGVDAVHSTG